ncbi:MAG TPA: group 1 truncated hemoglobin [Gemmatimonadales bacterium]|jgi:hemoglobin
MRLDKILLLATTLLGACHHGGGVATVQPAAPAPEAPAPMPRPLGAVAPRSPADPVPGMASASAPAASAANTPSLYSRLGGIDAIRAVVHDFRARVAADDRINAFFRGVNLDSLEQLIGDQICMATGGPCVYTGRTMLAAHTGLNIHDADFNALVEDLTAALDHFNVPAREKNELLSALAAMKGDIVGH